MSDGLTSAAVSPAPAATKRGRARRQGQRAPRGQQVWRRAPARRRPHARCPAPRARARYRLLRQQPSRAKRGQQSRGGAHGGVVFAAMQRAQSDGVGEAVEHHTARTRRGQDDRGRLSRIRWGCGHRNDAVAILHLPHRLFHPLNNALHAQPDRTRASRSAFLVGGPTAYLRAPQASTTPPGRRRQLGSTAPAERPIRHAETLP